MVYCSTVINVPPEVNELLNQCQSLIAAIGNKTDEAYFTPTVKAGLRGRPAYNITKDQVSSGFNVPQISSLLIVGKRTIERRLREFGISSINTAFSSLSNNELDAIVEDIVHEFPNIGYRRLIGFLTARGKNVQQQHVRESLRRVDPEGVLLRAVELNVVRRQPYYVPSPLALWHINGTTNLSDILYYKVNNV